MNLVLVAAVLWFFGFLAFAGAIPAQPGDAVTKVDGIVVLTGGGERLAAGFQLLDQGIAGALLISGVAQGVDAAALIEALKPEERPDPALIDCCVTLGHEASSTIDNASESRNWVRANNMRSIRLVTANYHINRSLLEFHRAMPDVKIVPNPVFPPEVQDRYWFANPRTLWLLVNEYHKSAAALARAACGIFWSRLDSGWDRVRGWVW